MKRLLIALVALPVVVGGTIPASGVPGPDPKEGEDYFEIGVVEDMNHGSPPPPPADSYSLTRFEENLGWDFGDRIAYACAWVEFFEAGDELFEVHYELLDDYPFDVKITDRYGVEAPDPEVESLCGDGIGPGANIVHDGSDHFPHGTALTFYKDGAEVAQIDYSPQHPGMCDKAYWTPGDEPGEGWLWWDEDGPQEHAPGMPLDCGGGPIEPFPVVRVFVMDAAPGVGYCTRDELEGSQCRGPTLEHSSTVTLKLKGHIRASGDVGVPDGTAECTRGRTVVIQRRSSGMWKKVGRDRTDDAGHYALHIRPGQGRYRAWVLTKDLSNGDICSAAISRRVVF